MTTATGRYRVPVGSDNLGSSLRCPKRHPGLEERPTLTKMPRRLGLAIAPVASDAAIGRSAAERLVGWSSSQGPAGIPHAIALGGRSHIGRRGL
jgi:hypothetical protein